MKITVWADFMCTFCYIGGAHLDKALADFDHADDVEIEYKSFLLQPDAAHDPDKSYRETVGGIQNMPMEQVDGMIENITNMVNDAGLVIDYDKIKYSSTIPAHHAFQYAKEQGKGNEFFEQFYAAHFVDGELLSDPETIVRLSEEIGLNGDAILQSTQDQKYTEKVNTDIEEAGQVGVQGVPFYVFNDKYAVSGAQPVAQFKQVLDKVWQEEK